MINQTYADIVTKELLSGAIENNEFTGFKQDYHVLHCLLRIHQPKSICEIGTNLGRGTAIICNAVPDAKVYSLDLPTELAHISLQHPINEGHGDKVGSLCKFPFTQLRGDSMTFNFTQYPCEAAYVDGEHDYDHPYTEFKAMIKNGTKLIIAHDADLLPVENAIKDAFKGQKKYDLFRVTDTRIFYAVKKAK